MSNLNLITYITHPALEIKNTQIGYMRVLFYKNGFILFNITKFIYITMN